MLRIEVVEATRDRTTLLLEGDLVGPWVAVLERTWREALARSTTVRLDLTGVGYIGRKGLDLIRRLADQRLAIVNCQPFVALQLRGSP
ncbi:MAG TPA: hypothetical protein VJV23_09060 [Candidatus Polarisedimenticolia bacterium]|nr:hypothetical protein [Candidatus Polarisedimenticolia bacterium]